MKNKLTIKLKNNDTITTSIEGWSEDIPAVEGWNHVFDWYRFSADPSFVLTDESKSSALLIKENIFAIYAELLPDNKPEPTASPKPLNWFQRIFKG